jgi:hypothetical protein
MSLDFREQHSLQSFREVFKFLYQIPDSIYFQLSSRELYLPSPKLYSFISSLSDKLDHHVITYNSAIFDLSISPEKHLCARLKGAELSKKQKDILSKYESETKKYGVSLVVYKKPIELIELHTSALYNFYQKNQLV